MDMFDMSHAPKPNANDGLHSPSSSRQFTPAECSPKAADTVETLSTDPSSERAALVKGMAAVQMPTLVLGVQSDILFPYWQQKEIAECLREAGNKAVTYYEVDAIYGHDTFLIDLVNIGGAVKGHLENSIHA
ncbi:hypothetical protein HK104_004075 [Borealophlyctis nickersoniae]|nr:hypothetical protein HK104_004075 [Borealophlyctis nickersoniae]